jgi:hypothetical protein
MKNHAKFFNQFTILFGMLGLFPALSNSLSGQLAPISNWTKVISNTHPIDDGLWEDMNPEIEIVGKTIHFLWISCRYNDREMVYYRNSTDGGLTLNPPKTIIDTTGNLGSLHGPKVAYLKRMAVSGSNIHIAFQIKECIFYSRSTDNGVSFSPPAVVYAIEDGHNHDFDETYISVLGNRVVIGFTETWYSSYMGAHASDAGMAIVSTDGGVTFNPVWVSPQIRTANLRDVIQSGSRIHALMADYSYHLGRVGVSTSKDDGASFSINWISDTLVTSDNNMECSYDNAYASKIAVAGNYVYVAWRAVDSDEVPKVFFCRSVDNGNTFEPPIALIDSLDSYYGDIWGESISVAAKGSQVYVTCARGWGTAYLLKSTDYGASFSSRTDLVSDANVFQYYQNGRLYPQIEFAPSDPTGKDVYCVMNNPKFRHSTDGFNTMAPLKIIDIYGSKGKRERTKLAVDENGTAHFVYEYTYGTTYAERWIYYRSVPLSQPDPSPANMSLALDYDRSIGRYDNMQIPSTPEICFTDALTVELWVKPLVESPYPAFILFKNSYDSAGGDSRHLGYGIITENRYNSRKPYAMISTTDDYTYPYKVYCPIAIEDGIWNHLALTYNAKAGENNFNFYLNGVLAGSETVTGNISPNQFESPLWVGGNITGGYNEFAGSVDELRLWNRALTQVEIAGNTNKELIGNENGLVAYYNFNNTTKDITGKGNDGILMYLEEFSQSNPVGVDKPSYEPVSFAVSQNFPNPFGLTTQIKYSVPFNSQVVINIFNAQGQVVHSSSRDRTPMGNYEMQFNAAGLPGGVYYYTIQAIELNGSKNVREMKKMILLK